MTIRTRLFSLLMAVVMVFSLMPTTALAADEHIHDGEVPAAVIGEAVEAPSAEDMAASAPYIDETYIYANGNNLTIEAGSAGYTKIKYGSSYLSFAGSGFSTGANANEADLSEATIYGGSTVTVNGGTVKELIGGDLNNTNGNVSITVNGGTVTNLYGGDNVSGNVNLTVKGGKVNYAYAVHEDGEIGGNFYVRVTDGGEIGWIHSYGIYNYNGNTSYSNEKMYVKAESGSAVERVYLPTDADSAFGAVLYLACQTELWTTSAFVSPSRWYDIKDEDKNAILARLEHTMWVTRDYEWWLLKGTIDGACQNEAFVIQKGESYSSDGNPASSKTITNYGTFTVSAWDDGNEQNHIVNYGTLILEDGCPLVQTVENRGTMVM